jgi:putative ABC transport system ATP-binding protein
MLSLSDIAKTYGGKVRTHALNGITLEIGAGEFVAITGPSGCGKSTLLNILGLIDTPSEGRFRFMGEEIARANEKRLTQLQRQYVGFVFQNFNLIEELTAAENVEVALIYRGVPGRERKAWVGRRWSASASPPRAAAGRVTCPAASSSAWRWRAPSSRGRS